MLINIVKVICLLINWMCLLLVVETYWVAFIHPWCSVIMIFREVRCSTVLTFMFNYNGVSIVLTRVA